MSSSGRLSEGTTVVAVESTVALDISGEVSGGIRVACDFGKGTASRFGERDETVILPEPKAAEENTTVGFGRGEWSRADRTEGAGER